MCAISEIVSHRPASSGTEQIHEFLVNDTSLCRSFDFAVSLECSRATSKHFLHIVWIYSSDEKSGSLLSPKAFMKASKIQEPRCDHGVHEYRRLDFSSLIYRLFFLDFSSSRRAVRLKEWLIRAYYGKGFAQKTKHSIGLY